MLKTGIRLNEAGIADHVSCINRYKSALDAIRNQDDSLALFIDVTRQCATYQSVGSLALK
jgi:hypothetical protein